MNHVIEAAASGRARCRGCELKIGKGELRFGERLPNMFGDGEMTLWFHPACAAYKRPEPFLEALRAGAGAGLDDAPALETAARLGIEHRRLPRVNGAERAPTGRARCRHCRETIAKGTWRVALVYFEEGRFEPSGFVHAACARPYFGTTDLIERARHFSPALDDADAAELAAALQPDATNS